MVREYFNPLTFNSVAISKLLEVHFVRILFSYMNLITDKQEIKLSRSFRNT